MSVRSFGRRYSRLLGTFDVVTMRITLNALDGAAWRAGDDCSALLDRWGITEVADIPPEKWHEFAKQQRAILRQYEPVLRTTKHEECHLRQNGSMPFCFSCALALRYCMTLLRRELRLSSLTCGLSAHPLRVPLFSADASQLPPNIVTTLSTIKTVYESWAIVNGASGIGEYEKAMRDTFGTHDDMHVNLTYGDYEGKSAEEHPLGSLAIVEGMARIAEILDYGLLCGSREYMEHAVEQELIAGKDIYGATSRLVGSRLGTPPLLTTIITTLLSDVAMLTLPSRHWPLAFGPDDDPLNVLPGLRFFRLIEMIVTGKLNIVRKLAHDPWYERFVTGTDETFDIETWFKEFIQSVYDAAGWASYDRMVQEFLTSIQQAGSLLIGLPPEKRKVLSYGSMVRQARRNQLLALSWHETSVHEQAVNPFLTSARMWLTDGRVIGPRAFAFEAVEELWQVAHFSWYNAILETGDLFGRSPVPEVPYLFCCHSREECSRDLSDVPSDCQWIDCFEELVGVPPRCFTKR